MKAVIYARVSTEEQAKDVRTSLRFQLQQSHEYREQCGYDLLEEVIDAGFSQPLVRRASAVLYPEEWQAWRALVEPQGAGQELV